MSDLNPREKIVAAACRAVIRALRELSPRPGALVPLTVLRARLGHNSPLDWSKVLLFMDDRRLVHLEPESDRFSLTAADHRAAIELAGRQMHLVRLIERPS
jgi:hypothetical protein